MDKNMILTRLDLAAAKAGQLKGDFAVGRLWDGDLERGIREIIKQLEQALIEARQ